MNCGICPTCGVTISENGQVLFSYGGSGTRERLYARVCQYAKDKSNCINQVPGITERVTPQDGYASQGEAQALYSKYMKELS